VTIPISQLEIWSNKGATATPKALREKIERVLLGDTSLITNKNSVEIYLQGSYRNSTNIYGNSDVDIVVQTNNVFYSDISGLPQEKKQIYETQRTESQYTWAIYKKEVLDTLRNNFGSECIEIGNKSIKIDTGSYEADVVPCIMYKKFLDYGHFIEEQIFIEGIKFFTKLNNREVINYPKGHYSFGTEKNQQTDEMFKRTVRVFKNIKSRLVNSNKLDKDTAPSYFIENLLFNVPNEKYVKNNLSQTIFNTLKWMGENRNSLSSLICQNGVNYLFGDTEEQWNESDARIFIAESIKLWNEWDN